MIFMRRRPLKPWHGVVFFLFIMAVFFLLCVPMQMFWGIYGVAATEVVILFISLAFAKIMGFPLKVLFPVRLPGFLPLLGTFLMWVSGYLITMVVMLIQYRLFPVRMNQVGNGLNQVIFSVPFLVSVLIVAVLPAICEEAVHRGVILHTLYPIRREWLVVLIMGIYFGFFHTDPLRFLPTAILGAIMSYIMLETENMVYSSFFHFINNFLPMLLSMAAAGASSTEQFRQAQEMMVQAETMTIPVASIGVYMILAAAAPFGFYLGNYLLHYRKGIVKSFIPRQKAWKTILAIVIPTVVLFGMGILMFVGGILFDPSFHQMMGGY